MLGLEGRGEPFPGAENYHLRVNLLALAEPGPETSGRTIYPCSPVSIPGGSTRHPLFGKPWVVLEWYGGGTERPTPRGGAMYFGEIILPLPFSKPLRGCLQRRGTSVLRTEMTVWGEVGWTSAGSSVGLFS